MSRSPGKYALMGGRQKPEAPAELVVPETIETLAVRLGMNKYELEFLLHTAHEQAPANDMLLHQFKSLISTAKLLFSEEANRHVATMRMHEAAYTAQLNAWQDRERRERDLAKRLADEEYFKLEHRRVIAAYDHFIGMLRDGWNVKGFTVQERRLFDALLRHHPDLDLVYNRQYVFFQTVQLRGNAPKLTPAMPWLEEARGLLLNLRNPSI